MAGANSALGIIGIILIIIGIASGIVGIVFLLLNPEQTKPIWEWILSIGGIGVAILGAIFLAIALNWGVPNECECAPKEIKKNKIISTTAIPSIPITTVTIPERTSIMYSPPSSPNYTIVS